MFATELTSLLGQLVERCTSTQRSWVQIPYRSECFSSGLLFTNAQVVFITAKISFIFTSFSAVQIYDFHIFTVVYSPLHGFNWNQHNDQLPFGRALHRYRRGQGFTAAQVLFITTKISFMTFIYLQSFIHHYMG